MSDTDTEKRQQKGRTTRLDPDLEALVEEHRQRLAAKADVPVSRTTAINHLVRKALGKKAVSA